MKKIPLLVLVLITTISSYSQNLKKVDEIVLNFPEPLSNPEELADLINENFDTEIEKSRAIYTWIASNIEYNTEEFANLQASDTSNKKKKSDDGSGATNVMTTGKAICDGYSDLFKRLCDLTGLKCVSISGATKTVEEDIGKSADVSNHAWNAVKIKRKWYLMDATWGAGFLSTKSDKYVSNFNDVWFMTEPEDFFLKHFPEDQNRLYVNKTKKDFERLPLYFSNFLDLDIEFIKPKSGVVKKVSGRHIEFKLKTSEDISQFKYSFDNSDYKAEMKLEEDGGDYTFRLPLYKANAKYVTLYHNRRAIVKYKLDLK